MRVNRNQDPKVPLLRNVDLFRGCSDRQLSQIARFTFQAQRPAGFVLCREGEAGREAFVIVDGEATVTIGGRQIGALGPGDVAGEMALLDHGPRVATVIAATPVTVLALSVREFAGLIDAAPPAAHRMLVQLGGRLRRADRAVVRD